MDRAPLQKNSRLAGAVLLALSALVVFLLLAAAL
jgi:hypothetical protein